MEPWTVEHSEGGLTHKRHTGQLKPQVHQVDSARPPKKRIEKDELGVLLRLKEQLEREQLAREDAEKEQVELRKQLSEVDIVSSGPFSVEERSAGRQRSRGVSSSKRVPEAEKGIDALLSAPKHMSVSQRLRQELNDGDVEHYTLDALEQKLYELKEELIEKDLCLRAERKGTAMARKFKESALSLIEKVQDREAELEQTRRQLEQLLTSDRSAWSAQEKKFEQNMLLLRKEIFQLTNALYHERRSNQRLAEQLIREREMKDCVVNYISERAKETAKADDPLLWLRK